ncbi:MAG: RagB/SusD family nutrient uptake outer membrane protein [Tannerella sp.]|jgi:hypothetical protein|nr:RagB/SusD family nutrient uptake outer membrane protein [Tannerella sp.]
MKKIILFILVSGFLSCTSLDETPDSILTSGQFYKTTEDATAAVNGVYEATLNPGAIMMYNRLFNLAMEVQTDDVIAGQRVTNVDVRAMSSLTHSTTNDRVDELWKEHYTAINRACTAIDYIEEMEDIDETRKTRLINEAKFLRGLLYFNLVRLWGEVPLVIHSPASVGKEDIEVSRTPVEDVYAQIIKDLTDAENLPAPNEYSPGDAGRATGGAAKALLSLVYLTRGEWNLAAQKSREVINGSYGYDLFENFADAFDAATKNGKEHVFSAQCQGGNGKGNRLGSSCTPTGIPGIAAAGTDELGPGVYELFEERDKRRDVTFFTSLVSPRDGKTYTFEPHFCKYFDPAEISNPTESNRNVPVIRFAEILLVHAEAVNEAEGVPSAEAYASVNRVRQRAGLDNLPVGLSQAEFREAVYLERRLELMFEFHRWFDLARTKRLISALEKAGKINVQERHYLLPVPQREIDLNPKLTQNPGWD